MRAGPKRANPARIANPTCEVHEASQVCTVKMGVQQIKYKTNPKVTIKHAGEWSQ